MFVCDGNGDRACSCCEWYMHAGASVYGRWRDYKILISEFSLLTGSCLLCSHRETKRYAQNVPAVFILLIWSDNLLPTPGPASAHLCVIPFRFQLAGGISIELFFFALFLSQRNIPKMQRRPLWQWARGQCILRRRGCRCSPYFSRLCAKTRYGWRDKFFENFKFARWHLFCRSPHLTTMLFLCSSHSDCVFCPPQNAFAKRRW